MARTRSDIRTLVEGNTGKTNKTTEINAYLEKGLKKAALVFDFTDIREIVSPDTDIVIGAMQIPVPQNTRTILSIRLFTTGNTQSSYLKLKNSTWWDKFITEPAANSQGWPEFGLRHRSQILFDRPSQTLSARFRITRIPSFDAEDDKECPIDVLDLFLEAYATAMVFLHLEDKDNYIFWITEALGSKKDRDMNIPGGLLLQAISADRRHPAIDVEARTMKVPGLVPPVASSDGDLGNLSWYRPS